MMDGDELLIFGDPACRVLILQYGKGCLGLGFRLIS